MLFYDKKSAIKIPLHSVHQQINYIVTPSYDTQISVVTLKWVNLLKLSPD